MVLNGKNLSDPFAAILLFKHYIPDKMDENCSIFAETVEEQQSCKRMNTHMLLSNGSSTVRL